MERDRDIKTEYLEFVSDVSELLVDPLDLGLLALTVTDIGDEDRQPSHAVATHSRHFCHSYTL